VLDILDEQETERGNYPQDGDVIKKKLKVDTDVKPTPAAEEDIFAFLDESIEKKKKLGRGKGLMDAAAAAIKWGHAPTAEKRGEAIAEGLSKMGEAGTKFAGEAMDLKDRAKILAAIEDKKGATKMAVQKSKNEYGMALNIKAYELAGFNKKESQAQALKDNITFAEYSKGTRKEQQDRFLLENTGAEATAKALRHYANRNAVVDPGNEDTAKSYLTEDNEDMLVVYDDGRVYQIVESDDISGTYVYEKVTINDLLL
jgi:hypothetical protein